MDTIGTVVKEAMNHILGRRCVSCGVRPQTANTSLPLSEYCAKCKERIIRKAKLTTESIDRKVIDIVEPLYANAVMGDIEPEIVEQLRKRESWQDVFLWGNPGVGKTYTMAAMIRAYIGQGYECMRSSWDEFCCRIRSTMSPASKETEWSITEKLKSVDMLFVDDLGLRSTLESDFVYSTFYLTLNKRGERLLPTIISSNKNLDRLKESLFDDRITSRLKKALIIEVRGKDRRQDKT